PGGNGQAPGAPTVEAGSPGGGGAGAGDRLRGRGADRAAGRSRRPGRPVRSLGPHAGPKEAKGWRQPPFVPVTGVPLRAYVDHYLGPGQPWWRQTWNALVRPLPRPAAVLATFTASG